jgi:transcriptional regulator with XRE-family HTH domain
MEPFSDWLTNQIQNRKMSPADLARAINKDDGTVSRILSISGRIPEVQTLKLIAKALKLPDETVLQAAGILSPKSEKTKQESELIYLFNLLPENQKDSILTMLRGTIELLEKRK